MSASMVACHSPQLRLTMEGLFWHVPHLMVAPLPLWSLPESLDLLESRRCPPPSVSSVKRAPCHTGSLEVEALSFFSHRYSTSTGLEDASQWQKCRARVCPPEAGTGRASTSGNMPQKIWGWGRQCPQCDDRSGPYQSGWCGTLF